MADEPFVFSAKVPISKPSLGFGVGGLGFRAQVWMPTIKEEVGLD